MHNLTKILFILNISLLTGCSNKNIINTPNNSPTAQTQPNSMPITRSPITAPQTQPTVSRRISTPSSTAVPISTPTPVSASIPNETTTPHQNFKSGTSYFKKKFKLPTKIKETSGLINVDGKLWTLNDSGGRAELYEISQKDGRILKTLKITNARNVDWEDMAYDDTYVYIGDIGNNRGNRKNLKIYKIPRASLRTEKKVRAEVIAYRYNDQKNFSSRPHKNNFDCEAMVAHNDKLYLFSKNWQNQKTRLYELSSQAGKHQAKYLTTFDIDGMVTGASLNEEMGILLLTTYSSLLNVELWAFTNYQNKHFFKGEKRRLNLKSPLQGQIEGVTFKDNYQAYLSSEAFSKYIFSFDASLYEIDFSKEFE